MIRIYNCIANEHDPWMVALAGVVAMLACGTAMAMLDRVAEARGLRRTAFIATIAVVTGIGVWATHFIAILGFRTGLAISFEPLQTAASLAAAIALLTVAIAVAVGPHRAAPAAGGAVAGVAIALMHYIGMDAFWIGGTKLWDGALLAASLALGIGLGAAAFAVALPPRGLRRLAAGAVLLAAAICSLHFTGMSAVSVLPDPTLAPPVDVVTDEALGGWVAAAAVAIVVISIAGLLMGYRQRRREDARLRELADAAVEGLAVCDGGAIATANAALARMTGRPAEELAGRPLTGLFDEADAAVVAELAPGMRVEARIRAADGGTVPVELVAHALVSTDRPRLAVAARDLRDRVAAEKRMRFLAHHDVMTGLPNRHSFHERLRIEIQRHQRHDGGFSLLYLDLDRFKRVNDVLGHAAGDEVLRTVGERVGGVIGEGDFLARLGGDEFAVICIGARTPADIARLAEAIVAAVAPDIPINRHVTSVGISIGIARFPHDGDTAGALQGNADVALYQAKTDGRGDYRFFEASLGAKLRERHALELDLRRAITHGELDLVYQPQVSARDEVIIGFEALLRWNSPGRGDIAPQEFIPIAEESGLILPIGEWVLQRACAEAASWPKPLRIAVNVSGVQLRQANFSERVAGILAQTGLAAERLEIEITETALVEDFEQALAALGRLKAQGIRIAMDDFGTGYSSLSNLRAFPFDKLKIDRSFVRNVDSNADGATIVRAILGLSRGLNLAVVAEGVETAGERQFLDQEECPEMQGFIFGRPGRIADFPEAFSEDVLPLRRPSRRS
ncbi:MAG: putative bifunctional diguanylate cyclase/phosphodiesterase [Alphaproteobacteria bacterium]